MKSVSKTTCFCPWHGGEDTTLTEIDIGYDDDGDSVGGVELDVKRNPATGYVESTGLLGVSDGRCYNGYGECTNYAAAFEGLWKLQYFSPPSIGTYYWLKYGYNQFQSYYGEK